MKLTIDKFTSIILSSKTQNVSKINEQSVKGCTDDWTMFDRVFIIQIIVIFHWFACYMSNLYSRNKSYFFHQNDAIFHSKSLKTTNKIKDPYKIE